MLRWFQYWLILHHSDTDSLLTYMYVNGKEQQYTCIYYPAFVRYTVCIVVCCIKKPSYFTFFVVMVVNTDWTSVIQKTKRSEILVWLMAYLCHSGLYSVTFELHFSWLSRRSLFRVNQWYYFWKQYYTLSVCKNMNAK